MINKLTQLILLLAAMVALMPSVVCSQTLTLDQAVDMALKNNEKVLQYREKLNQAQYSDREAWGNFLPSVKLQASYNHLNDPLIIDLNPIRQAMITLQANNQVEFANVYSLLQGQGQLTAEQRAALYNQYSTGLNALIPQFKETLKKQDYNMATLVGVQPIFMGGKLIAAKKAAAAEKHFSESELIKVKNEIIQETINNYLAVVLLSQVVCTRQDVFDGMQKHRANARRLSEEGLIARYDLLRAEVAVADADRNLFDDNNRLEMAKIALCHSAGLPDDSPIEIVDSLRYYPVSDTLDFFIKQAKISQPILQMISSKKQEASQKVAVERSEFLPQLVGFGKYELNDKDLSALEPKWVVGVQLNISIFNGFRDYHRLRSAIALRHEVEYLEAGTKRQIDLWLNKSYRDMRNAETRYAKLEASINLADESVRLNEKRFSSGLGTSLEVIDARLSLEKNKIERLTSLYDYYKSLADLLTAAGCPQDLLATWDKKEQ
jgi:outer membrane protein TolC